MQKNLSAKEALFCEYLKILASPREAAARAGFPFPERTALRLLRKEAVKAEISKRLPLPDAADGLRRLAFGSICDAVYLCTSGETLTREELEKLDLYSVSELKFGKGGTIEVKFFDRIKALSMLCSQEGDSGSAEPFYKALMEGAKSLNEAGEADGI